VWVLTGDKIGTAINIGMSAGLLDNSEKMDQYIIRESNHIDKLIEELSTILFEIKKNDMKHDTAEVISNNPNKKKKTAIVVAGASLTLLDHLDSCKSEFLQITDRADVVLACRVSPK
jgi:magnesium-transporting ATPase (P-type)